MAIERGQFIVSGCDALGNPALVDVLDLDQESFRAFVLDRLVSAGLIRARYGWKASGQPIPYRAKVGAKVQKA